MSLSSAMVLPLLIVVAAGVYYIYNEVMQFMSKSLVQNKVVVITDAMSGVGTECAHLFHKGGARLILCGTSWDKLESLYDSLTNDADPRETFAPKLVIVDFSDMPSMEEVVAEVVECYGCVDVLICNSSMKLKAPVQSVTLEVDRNIMDINYFGPSTLAKGVLPTMISRRSGHIVLVNSIQGRLAIPFRSSFIAKQMTHGVRPSVLADEIMQTVNRKRTEVMLAHPIPRVALYLRSLIPSFLFAVLGAGVKDSVLAEQMQ
ncbi:dehydrogenase/reductase (SDR family) member 7Cb isoform X2 [Sparus aurata]|uniref:dehydrogenase/reductase (SDR family) member 7Cb isoform X2 n=1 Tax=Sparus aurata TaxID=8175 RepID=UPI0011C12DA4|nr:dehydrogenase/reductase SDR family member 7C-A-like isoform X2 [Sparus aurata]